VVRARAHIPAAPDARRARWRSRRLRTTLIAVDAAGASLAWATAFLAPTAWVGGQGMSLPVAVLWFVGIVGFILAMNGAQQLYRSRVCGVHAIEHMRVARTAVFAGVAALPLARALGGEFTLRRAALGAALGLVALTAGRMQFDDWLRAARRGGSYRRPVVVVGTGPEAQACITLLADHPDTGFEVRGVVGSDAHAITDAPYLGPTHALAEVLETTGVRSVMIASDALSGDARDQLMRDLVAEGVHVQLVGGLPGLSHRRLRVVPLAHTPSFYIERPSLTRVQRGLKRGLDVGLASLALVIASPLFAMVALTIFLDDRGPVFYRQTRVGRDGREFRVWKFRTMIREADTQVAALSSANERSGPLFKLARDPRRTRVGRVLEATSIDELPQLINVVRGEMSLVGPRPALPREVAQFDAELLERLQVLPGITGLWQVEARENPSFGAYRRLDLFYVENWSLGLDLAILAGTVHAVASRITRRRAA